MTDHEISTDPADYISGPTGAQAARSNGGTNRDGGVTTVDVDETVQTTQTAAPATPGESTPAPAPALNEQGQQQMEQQQAAGGQGA